jgi:hypothetical protein
MVPGLEAWLMESLEDDMITVAELVRLLFHSLRYFTDDYV